MATFGIENISKFSNHNKKSGSTASDLPTSYISCNDFFYLLHKAGHAMRFKRNDDDCWEKNLRATSFGGDDDKLYGADDVELFFISTHGGNDGVNAELCYNVKKDDFHGNSSKWRLGRKLKWLLLWGCSTIADKEGSGCWNIFQKLHEICGAYGNMIVHWSTEETGYDVADNLTEGHTMASSWLDGTSDWFHNNHPIVVASENNTSYAGGKYVWLLTTMNLDGLPPHCWTVPDVLMEDKVWLSTLWLEKNLWRKVF